MNKQALERLRKGQLSLARREDIAPALTWLLAHLGRINDGGTWAIPRSLTIYRVDKKHCILWRTGPGDESTESLLPLAGWTVRDESDKPIQDDTVGSGNLPQP